VTEPQTSRNGVAVAAELPAERVAQAHRRLEAGGVRGRLVLTF